MGLPTILLAASSAMQAYGSIREGQAQSASSTYQAQVAKNNQIIANQNADYEIAAGETRAQAQEIKTAQLVGSQKAQQSSNGLEVNSGSNVDVRASTAALGKLDALTIRSNAARAAYGYQTEDQGYAAQAVLDRATGANAKTASYIDAATSIIGGASKYTEKYGTKTGAGAPRVS